MSFGTLTEVDKLRLQERTSLFINSAGTAIQRTANVSDAGVSAMKLYKVLANAIWDWHWLADSNKGNSAILGIGDLKWVPHRFGSLGQVAPQLKYPNISLRHGYFATFAELYQSKLYSQFGFRGARVVGSDTHFFFSKQPLTVQQVKKQALTIEEWLYWAQIIECYSRQTLETLNAMASCRNDTAFFHNLWIQYVVWKRNAGVLMARLRDQEIGTIRDVDELISSASASIAQLRLKSNYYRDREKYVALVREAASYTEFSTSVPFLREGTTWSCAMTEKSDKLRCLIPSLESLHELVVAMCYRIGIVSVESEQNSVEGILGSLVEAIPQMASKIEMNAWNSIWLRRNVKQVGAEVLNLINLVYSAIEELVGLEFGRVGDHYRCFFKEYPLPCDGFTSGY